MSIKRVAIYLRKSRDEEHEEKEIILKRHETQLLDYCKRNNLAVIKIYREIVSGDTIEKRPEMQQLLDDVSAKMYDGVVCMEIERLSRGNQLDQLEILETFKASATKIYTLSKVYDLSNEDIDEEYFEFALFMSRREYKIIKRRMQRGRRQALLDGYFISSICPFGYGKERQGRGFVLVPNEQTPILQDIFNRCANGEKITDIARYLNSADIKPIIGESFNPNMVRRILNNKTYLGYIYSKKDGTYYDGRHEAIINEDLFNIVQERITIKTNKKPRGKELRNPLASILRCGKCGRTLALQSSGKMLYFNCPNMDCKTSGAMLSMVEDRVLEELRESLQGFNYFLDNYESEIATKKENIDIEIKALKTEIKKRNSMIDKACEMLELGVYSKEKFLERTNLLEKEIEANQARLLELESVTFEDESARDAIPKLEKVLELYPTLTAAEKNRLLKTIIERIDYYKTEKFKKLTKDKDILKLNIFLKV